MVAAGWCKCEPSVLIFREYTYGWLFMVIRPVNEVTHTYFKYNQPERGVQSLGFYRGWGDQVLCVT